MKRFRVVSKPTDASRDRPEGLRDGGIGREERLALTRPVKLVTLPGTLDNVAGQFLAQQVEVDGPDQVAVGGHGSR